MDLKNISQRLATLAAKVPVSRRVPHLAIILDGDPNAETKRRAAEAIGDPILNVTLFNSTDQQEQTNV